VKWVNQRTAGDEWHLAFGDSSPEHPDFDIGDSPQVYKLGGRTVVSAGQKSGFFHVLDAATGAEVNDPIQLAPAGTVGGLFADSAYADGVVYANGTDWPAPIFSGDPPNRGILSAVKADGSEELWSIDTDFSPNISGVAVANGVVYFQSMFGMFYALEADSGDVLAEVFTGGQSSGPAVSRGQIYLGTGDTAFPFLDPSLPIGPGSIIALGIEDEPGGGPPFFAPARNSVADLLQVVQVLRDHGSGHDLTSATPDVRARIDADGNGQATLGDLVTVVSRLRGQSAAEAEFDFAANEEGDRWDALLDILANALT
jgi:hypothetical protein